MERNMLQLKGKKWVNAIKHEAKQGDREIEIGKFIVPETERGKLAYSNRRRENIEVDTDIERERE